MSETKEQSIAAVAQEVVVEMVNDVAESTKEANTTDEIIDNVGNVVEEKLDEAIDNAEEKVKQVVTDTTELIEEKVDEAKDDVLEFLKNKVRDLGVKKSTLALVVKFTMEAVEKTPLKGKDQKDYALRLIRALVEDLATGDEKDFLLTALDSGAVGDTIDLIVDATQGKLDINGVIEVASTSCIPCCLSLLSKKSKKKAKK